MNRFPFLAAALICSAAVAAPALAQDISELSRPFNGKLAPGVFEVTARGREGRVKRSSFDRALLKAAKGASKRNGLWFAVVYEKSGTWWLGRNRLGDETLLRFRIVDGPEPVLDERGAPARVFNVAEILGRAP